MASLIETTAFAALLPVETGPWRLTAADPGLITSVAPFAGQTRKVAAALKPLGLRYPAAGQWQQAETRPAEIFWAGHSTAFLCGALPPARLAGAAALTDQTDGWAAMDLSGVAQDQVMARICPLDLRPTAFPVGSAARSMIGHMPAILLRRERESLRILVFRSMALTAVGDLSRAMAGLAARWATATPALESGA